MKFFFTMRMRLIILQWSRRRFSEKVFSGRAGRLRHPWGHPHRQPGLALRRLDRLDLITGNDEVEIMKELNWKKVTEENPTKFVFQACEARAPSPQQPLQLTKMSSHVFVVRETSSCKTSSMYCRRLELSTTTSNSTTSKSSNTWNAGKIQARVSVA